MTSWTEARIRDVARTFDGPHATPKSTKTASSGPIFLGISSLDRGRLDLNHSAFISEEDLRSWTRRVAPTEGDVVFSYETRLGEAAIIPEGFRGALGRRLALMRPDRSKVDPRFLLYYFLGPAFQEVIRKNTVQGSTVDRISLSDFPDFPIFVPPLPEQHSIAATLGALDDKIESNTRLAGAAQGLVKAAFQRSMRDGDPRFVLLGDVATCVKGVSYKSVELSDSPTSLVTLKSFDRRGGYKRDGLKPYVGRFKQEQVITPGEIAVAQTDLTQGAEVVGRAIRVPASETAATLVASLDLVIVRPDSSELTSEYLFGALTTERFRKHCRSRTSGTTVLHLASNAIPEYELPLVTRESREAFTSLAAPLLDRMDVAARESVRLSSLRDVLLPELLSGRIRVGDLARESTRLAGHIRTGV